MEISLYVSDQYLRDVDICRGMYQRDRLLFMLALMPVSSLLNQSGKGFQVTATLPKLSHLLYLDDLELYAKNRNELESLLHTVRIFSSSIGMEFGLNKCATVSIERGKFVSGEDITLPSNEMVSALDMSQLYQTKKLMDDVSLNACKVIIVLFVK